MIQKNNLLLAASIALFLQTRWVSAFHVSNPHKNVNLRRFPGRMDHGGVHTRTKNSVSFFVLPQDEAGEDVLTNDKHIFSQREGKTRRSVVQDSSRHLLLLLSAWQPRSSPAAAAVTTETSSSSTTTAATTLPKITDRILIDVRIARPDGTFYVRGDETDDLVKKYSLKIGLFGKAAPTHVERFLSYVRPSEEVIRDDKPFPSYSQSRFQSFDEATGVLYGGTIPSLETTEFAGSTALRYGGRILPAPLWLESKKSSDDSSSEPLPLPHSTKGLLIHRKLDVSPTFGITTRSDAGTYVSDFDLDNVAFGVVLEGMDFLEYCSELPTYSVERPQQDEESLVQDAAKAVFDAQRDFFRGAAKSFGDTRVSKLVPGKLLRRVEVTRVALL